MDKLQAHRDTSDINSRLLTEIVFGGKEKRAMYERAVAEAKEVGYVPDLTAPEMSRVDAYSHVYEQSLRFKKTKTIDFMSDNIPDYFLYLNNVHVRGGVGLLMSLHLIMVLGTDEQARQWAPKIASRDWIACYAQTELAHGSDVQNLQTIATFDNKTQEFIIHTPSVDAIKWWPGDLGVSATHGVIMVRLLSNGVDNGVFPLFIQLRDLNTHKVLPGLEIGDIGPKLGYHSKDNGFLRFDNFRVPKSSLLGRYYKIDEEGNFKTVGNPKIIYSSMMESRTALMNMHCAAIFKGLQIVCRYSILRTQFKDEKGVEIPIINYVLQKYKLMKFASRGYAMVFSNLRLARFLKKNAEMVKQNNFDYLQEAHVYLCGYKAYFTWTGVQSYSEMIQAAGGHGFSYYSGLTSALTELFPDTILEGENSLLCLQIARHLLKSIKMVQEGNGSKIKGATQYLKDIDDLLQFSVPLERAELLQHSNLLKGLAKTSAFFVQDAAMAMIQHISSGLDPKEVWNTKMGIRLLSIGKLHSIYTIAYESLAEIGTIQDKRIKEILTEVHLYFLIEIYEEYASFIVQAGAITGEHLATLKEKREELIEFLSPHLLKLCEAYDISDQLLWSAIGHSNGKPYENLYEWAKKYGSLNKFAETGHPAHHRYKL